jgi:histidine triad (HIT) family protein
MGRLGAAAFGGRATGIGAESMASKNIFQRIIDREIPAQILHEDDRCLAFRDVQPQAPTHVLIVPKRAIESLDGAATEDAELLGHLLIVARDLARKLDLSDGYRLVANCGRAGGQTVPHLHFHLLGGRDLSWPPG